jgi:hypothetical protein
VPGEIVTAASILVSGGTGGWLADKLLGPSFNALGEQFRAFAGKRLSSIFSAADKLTDQEKLEALPPGFALEFLQKASFSEDDEGLTRLWAGLLIEASKEFDSRHVSFVSILSQLTSTDAEVLNGLVSHEFYPVNLITIPVTLNLDTRTKIASEIKNVCDSDTEAEAEISRLIDLDLGWPGKVTSIRIYYKDGDKQHVLSGGLLDKKSSFENLLRLGLLEKFEVSNSLTPYAVGVEGYLVTVLGLMFIQTCRGDK